MILAVSKVQFIEEKIPDNFLLFAMSVSGDAATPGRRVYTVLPPPADYKTDSEKSITLPQSESINSAEDPAGKTTIISHLWTFAVHHKARRDLLHGVSPGWLSRVLQSLSLNDNQLCF